jgi:predicted nucleic acid-binding protein
VLILDVPILEEVIRPVPDARVGAWLASQIRDDLYTTSLAQAAIHCSVERLAPGKRRADLLAAVGEIFAFFDRRVLSFDSDAAKAYPVIVINRKMMGTPLPAEAAMLAAIARSRGATLATRNSSDFAGCGVRVVSPWELLDR